MIEFIRKYLGINKREEKDMKVSISQMPDGTYAIIDQNGSAVQTYGRARDARRGARRRGFTPLG